MLTAGQAGGPAIDRSDGQNIRFRLEKINEKTQAINHNPSFRFAGQSSGPVRHLTLLRELLRLRSA
jgi:hypothetical protein